MRILTACEWFPEQDISSGDMRLFELIKILRQQSHEVVCISQRANDRRYRLQLEQLGVECVCDAELELTASAAKMRVFLTEANFDFAVMSQYQIYNCYAPYLREYLPDCHIVCDTVDLQSVRTERESVFYPELRELAESVRRWELSALQDADSIWVVTEREREVLRSVSATGCKPIYVVPNIHSVAEPGLRYHERSGIVFIGGYNHRPNVDAVHYFMSDIYPRLRAHGDIPVTIAGSNVPASFDCYRDGFESVTIAGFIADHRKTLAQHRLGMAPLRFGAGMKGKICEYLACGLPCVTTSIGAEGMDLTSREVLVADDAKQFVQSLIQLYYDQELWQGLANEGRLYIERRCSPEAVSALVTCALEESKLSPPSRKRTPYFEIARFYAGNPGKIRAVFSKAIAAARAGGVDELYAQANVWLRKPR